ncbi:WD40-repeat-containing domain protein, partial [Gaertneriomyces semiglobifer]
DFRIIVGTYERLLYGLNVRRIADPALDSVDRFTVKPVFIYPAHITCIKAAATSSRFLATGSTDEHVKVYDLRQRKEVGTLMHHSGSITCLKFYQRTHLMTGSEDGNIAIVRTRDWEVLKTLPAHKRSVNWMDVHPSGKVLLSVGGDGALKCWDMARGACAYSMKLPKPAERVCWSPTGTHYAVLMNDIVQVHAIEDGSLVCTIKQKGRINTIAYAKLNGVEAFNDAPEAIITGSEDRNIGVWSTSGKPLLRWASGHNNRIKDLDIFSYNKKSSVLVTCSSDGGIKVWDLNDVQKQLATPQAEYNAGCRLTCL